MVWASRGKFRLRLLSGVVTDNPFMNAWMFLFVYLITDSGGGKEKRYFISAFLF